MTAGLSFYNSSALLYHKQHVATFRVHDLKPWVIFYYGKLGRVVRRKLKWATTLLSDGNCTR